MQTSYKTAGHNNAADLAFSGDEFRDWLALGRAIDDAGEVACSQFPDVYFPNDGYDVNSYEYRLAKRMCEECPIRQQCLDFALKWNPEGLWGGLSKPERKYLKRSLKRR